MDRGSGILMHIASLNSPYGIGTLGKEAYHFVDFLKKAGQKYWQILPLNPTGYSNSPYQSFSTFAANPYFIDLDLLKEKDLLSDIDLEGLSNKEGIIDYGLLYKERFIVLKKAAINFLKQSSDNYLKFKKENAYWLNDYALFMTLKDYHKGESWDKWPKDKIVKLKISLEKEIEIYKVYQYFFFEQWFKLKDYCNSKGIKIIGDLPIYVAYDSADVFFNQDLFILDKDGKPSLISGCPPDAFSSDGQLWNTPIYNWQRHKKDNYKWWSKRLKMALKYYDIVRIDHFRGFDEFWAIPYGDKTAKNGKWLKGPGLDLFKYLKEANSENIIAEDLGYLTISVKDLLKKTGFYGMRVLEFAFDKDFNNPYLPHNHIKESILYLGTHDNDTLLNWYANLDNDIKTYIFKYLGLNEKADIKESFLRALYGSISNVAIVQMQDLLGLKDARMNYPGTSENNWMWRIQKDALNDELAKKIFEFAYLYGRI